MIIYDYLIDFNFIHSRVFIVENELRENICQKISIGFQRFEYR